MIKIRVQRHYSLFLLIMLFVGSLVFIFGAIYFLIFSNFDFSTRTRSDLCELIGLLAFVVFPLLFSIFSNKEKYVSEIYIFNESIEIIYKIKGKEVERKQILKKDIEKFDINTKLELKRQGRSSYTYTGNTVSIKTKNDEISFFNSSENTFFGCPYQLILDLIKYRKEIPNFKYKVSGSNIFAKKDIEYFYEFEKRLPLKEKIKFLFSQISITGKIFLSISAILFVFYFGLIAYFFMPMGKLSDGENEYMQHYNKAVNLRVEERNYTKALIELEKAEKFSSTTPEIYLEKAYNYKKLKQYNEGKIAAKEGLKYLNSKSIYNKYHNFRAFGKKDVALYTVLGELCEETKDYKGMKDSYDYVIKHTHYKYTDAYFNRGRAEYYLLEFDLAYEDMLKHKEIIQNYLTDQQEAKYKALYPFYDNNNLENVELWLKAIKKYGNI